MAKGAREGPAPLHRRLPDEILIWEIFVRLPPQALLRCRAVCRTWRHATSARDFLLAHHGLQPYLPIVSGFQLQQGGPCYHNILLFDHRAVGTQLQPVTRLRHPVVLEASCDGLLILSQRYRDGICFFVCNPATRQHASLGPLQGFSILRMYLHRPTGEYRLLLHGHMPKDKIGCYVSVLASNQPPRYIGGAENTSELFYNPAALFRDDLHWYPVNHQSESKLILIFDTTTESFRRMHAPVVPSRSYILEMDDTIGIYSYNDAVKTVDIWVLQNYESEIWNYKYKVELPTAEIRERSGQSNDYWYINVVSVDSDIFLLLSIRGLLLYIDTDGKFVDSLHRNGQNLYAWKHRLKQTLVPHTFFAALEGYAVNDFPFA